jgi:galactokinase
MEKRRRYISKKFKKLYGRLPSIWARAPGRVDLMGSHTDYNMGFVMTMTIDRDTWIAAYPREDNQVAIYSCNISGGALFSLENIQRDEFVPWTNYVRGVAAMMKASGYELCGFDGLVHSTIPFGSGLSSSAAIEMASAFLFRNLSDLKIDPVDMALIGQKAENDFVGVSTGILDQYSSVMGRDGCAILLDCRHLTSDVVRISPNLHVVICDTRAERKLVGTDYDERRDQCEEGVRLLKRSYPEITALRDVTPKMFARKRNTLPELIARRCQFIIEENQRVMDLAQALPEGSPELLHALFAASYKGARDLYEIGSPTMVAMMHAMLTAPGVVAARQAGAGFGGSMVALVKDGFLEPFTEHVTKTYHQEIGIQPEVYAVQTAPGAMILDWTQKN